jgi:hypothetical protein
MIKLVSTRLWSHIVALSAKTHRKCVAVAYISDDSRIQFGKGDLLIVDASNERIASGDTSARVLVEARQRGAEIYSLQGLHAKFMILDDIVVIGSANISKNSYSKLFEAGVITDTPAVVKQAGEAIERLKLLATPVKSQFIKHIQSIPVSTVTRNGGKTASTDPKKPSLLDALRTADPYLKDFVIGFWEGNATLSDAQVKADAKLKGVKLPSSKYWYRYEEPATSRVDLAYSEVFDKKGYKLISLRVKSEGKRIAKVISVDPYAQLYFSRLRIGNLLETNFVKDRRPPFRLGGNEAKELCELLTEALMKNPQVARRMFLKPGWTFSPRDISQLLSSV